MTFKPALWQRIAVVLSVLNVGGAGFAALSGEPLHASVHVALAVAFGIWALRLGQRQRPDESQRDARVEVLEAEVSDLQRELSQAQEGLDFAERLLARRPEPERVDAKREDPKDPKKPL